VLLQNVGERDVVLAHPAMPRDISVTMTVKVSYASYV